MSSKIQTLFDTVGSGCRRLLNSASCRIQKAAVNLRSEAQTWMTDLQITIRNGRTQQRQYDFMNRQFYEAVNACYRHGKISKKELQRAKKDWEKQMRNVKEEDKRRKKLWGSY